jgi:hypothetical protein
MPEEKEDKGFKVIDRRGVEPPSPPPTPPLEEKPPMAATEGTDVSPPKHPQDATPHAGAKEGKGPSPLGVPRFLDLVQSLQMGAMVGLGLLQGPDGKRPPVDLPGAKDAIDLLGVLQEKTKGNLTKEEDEVLREGLYHLRMGYMAIINANAPPAGRGKGGDPR